MESQRPSGPGAFAGKGEIPPHIAEDICAHIQTALSRFGAHGQVRIRGATAELYSPTGVIRCSIGLWWNDWSDLNEATRSSNATHVARQLAAQRPASILPSKPPTAVDSLVEVLSSPWSIAGIFALVAMGVAGAFLGSRNAEREAQGPGELPSGQGPAAFKSESERSARACVVSRQRIEKRAPYSLADADGWLVEVSILKAGGGQPLSQSPALASLLKDPSEEGGTTWIGPGSAALSGVQTSDSVVMIEDNVFGVGEGIVRGLRLQFGGSLVDPFFTKEGRAVYFEVAAAISSKLEATHAALYGRCEGEEQRALGAWFQGEDETAAAESFLYFLGTYAEPPHIAPPFLRAPGEKGTDRALVLKNISSKLSELDSETLQGLVSKEGGALRGKKAVTVSFPFRDGSRATRVSQGLAQWAGLSR